MYKRGTRVSALPEEPFSTVSIIGRGGLVPRVVFETIGLYDEKRLPHYGADADFALRAWSTGFSAYVVPAARVLLHTDQTGMTVPHSLAEAIRQYGRYLLSRKHGEALRTLYFLNTKHLPVYTALPSYLFMLTFSTFRYWQRFVRAKRRLKGRICDAR